MEVSKLKMEAIVFDVEKDILFYALRYSIGRRTFAPMTVITNIKRNINKFSETDLQLILKEIKEHDNYGMECDAREWFDLVNYVNKQLEELNRREY